MFREISKQMIQIKNLSKVYTLAKKYKTKYTTPNKQALTDINIELPSKGFVFLLGKSGCGKTTLLNLISGIDTITSGDIIVDGLSLSQTSTNELDDYRRLNVGYIFQDSTLVDYLTVEKNIALGLELVGQKPNTQTIIDYLQQVDLQPEYASKPLWALSGGQKQRVAIATALAKNSRILVADEPTGNLDITTGTGIFDLLKAKSKDRLVIVATHDTQNANQYADRIICIEDGRIMSDTNKDIINDSKAETNTNEITTNPSKVENIINQTDTIPQINYPNTNQIESSTPTQTPTTPTNHNAQKAKLPLRYNIIFGLKCLISQKLRLAFSILLPVIILALFSVSLTAQFFDAQKANLRQLYSDNAHLAKISINTYQDKAVDRSLDELSKTAGTAYSAIDSISVDYTNYLGLDNGNAFLGALHKDIKDLEKSSMIVIDNVDKATNNFAILQGRFPQSTNEIALPDIVYNYIQPLGQAKDFQEFSQFDFDIVDNMGNALTTKVVGVFLSGYQYSKYYNDDSKIIIPGYNAIASEDRGVYTLQNTTALMPLITQEFADTISQNLNVQYDPSQLKSAIVLLSKNLAKDKSVANSWDIHSTITQGTIITETLKNEALFYLNILSIFALVFASLLIANFITASINANKKIIGILRAMGATKNNVFAIFYTESISISIISSILSFILATFAGIALNNYLPGLFSFNILSFFATLGISLIITTIVVLLPILKYHKKSPIELIKQS